MSFATVHMLGNLTREPESRYSQNGTLMVSFGMAVNGRRKDDKPTFYRVTAFGEQAERIAAMVERGYIAKGKGLFVSGNLEESEFKGNDGQQRKSLEVTLTDWQFVGGNQQGGNDRQADDTAPF